RVAAPERARGQPRLEAPRPGHECGRVEPGPCALDEHDVEVPNPRQVVAVDHRAPRRLPDPRRETVVEMALEAEGALEERWAGRRGQLHRLLFSAEIHDSVG